MIRRILLVSGLLLASILARSEPAPSVYASVVSETQTFRLLSPSTGEWTVDISLLVNDPKGRSAAALLIYTDSFRSLSSFSGEITPLGGGKTIKLRQKDLVYYALSEGLADDGASWSYLPDAACPMMVHYSYKISYRNGIASFPTYMAVPGEKVHVAKGTYIIDVPEDVAIKHLSGGMIYSCETLKGRTQHRWTLADYAGYVAEDAMPSTLEMIPYVYASPVAIDYGGYAGSQEDWHAIGGWLAQMQIGRQQLAPEQVTRLQELTRDCDGPAEKLSVLYQYLRQTTRYVSIQLGIGGLRPMAASEVCRMGFSDCKGLSNYLRAMLLAVDVPSDYYILHDRRARLLPGYASVGQMNHAMLAVPLPELGDTAWVECTNPIYPLGYRHSGVAGHEIVLVHDGGGQVVRVPGYPDTLSREVQRTYVSLAPDGSAQLRLRRELFLDRIEPYLDFRDLKPDVRMRMLTRAMKLHAEEVSVTGISDNFDTYQAVGRGFVPQMCIDYTMTTRLYANVNGDRMFVPINPVAQMIPAQKSKRVNDFVVRGTSTFEDLITIPVPEGWQIESLPKDETLDTEWGRFRSSARLEGGTIEIRQWIRLLPGRTPASSYDAFRAFARSVNKSYAATLVLRKTQL